MGSPFWPMPEPLPPCWPWPMLVPLPPSWPWQELWGLGWPWLEGLLRCPQIRALTSAPFLSVPALQGKANDSSPSVSSLALETLRMLGTAVEEPPSGFSLRALRYRLRRAWRRMTRTLGDGWLCCRSCVQG